MTASGGGGWSVQGWAGRREADDGASGRRKKSTAKRSSTVKYCRVGRNANE